jgi:hypothetical protein
MRHEGHNGVEQGMLISGGKGFDFPTRSNERRSWNFLTQEGGCGLAELLCGTAGGACFHELMNHLEVSGTI